VIVALGFDAPERLPDGRVVRAAHFRRRSSLPASAACLVANGAREQLSRLLAIDLETEVTEPAVLDAAARTVLFAGGFAYRVRGHGCDAFVALRAPEAKRLAAAAFGELDVPADATLSVLERATLERLAGALTALCAPLCGAVRAVQAESPERAAREAETYFEVRTGGRVVASVGFALSRDPAEPAAGEPFALEELEDVEIPCCVEFARGALNVGVFSRLAEQTTIALDTPIGAGGTLFASDVPLLRGICGARDGRSAFAA
jgi:flagellar motor switch/type III secretory pathway protein FliN